MQTKTYRQLKQYLEIYISKCIYFREGSLKINKINIHLNNIKNKQQKIMQRQYEGENDKVVNINVMKQKKQAYGWFKKPKFDLWKTNKIHKHH